MKLFKVLQGNKTFIKISGIIFIFPTHPGRIASQPGNIYMLTHNFTEYGILFYKE